MSSSHDQFWNQVKERMFDVYTQICMQINKYFCFVRKVSGATI